MLSKMPTLTTGAGGTRVGNRSLMHEVVYECPNNGWGFPSTGTRRRDARYSVHAKYFHSKNHKICNRLCMSIP